MRMNGYAFDSEGKLIQIAGDYDVFDTNNTTAPSASGIDWNSLLKTGLDYAAQSQAISAGATYTRQQAVTPRPAMTYQIPGMSGGMMPLLMLAGVGAAAFFLLKK